MNKYLFNGTEYFDLNSLGEAYASDFGLAIQDAFSNTKLLLKFIKRINKAKAKECARIFVETKYQNNVITFLIFNLCNDPRVIINGLLIDFPNFIKILSRERNNKALNAFIEDFGITKTYSRMDIDKFLSDDSFLIEKNFKDDFTYKYLINYHKIDYSGNVHDMLSNELIYDEEVFRRTLKIIKEEKFQLLLAKKCGFKAVYDLRITEVPTFKALRLLVDEFHEEDLRKILDGSYFIWLMDNLDKYEAKGKAKEVYNNLVSLKRSYDKLKEKTFASYVDYAEEVYYLYVKFVKYMNEGLIKVNKKYDTEAYTLNIKYCTSMICPEYIKTHTVKLSNNEEAQEEVKEDITEQVDDNDTFEIKKCNKRKKEISKLKRFANWQMALSILAADIIIGVIIIMFIPDIPHKQNYLVNDYVLWIILGVATLISIVMTVVIRIRNDKSSIYLSDYIMANNKSEIGNDSLVSVELAKKKELVLQNEIEYKKKAFNNQRFFTAFSAMFAGLVYSASALFVVSLFVEFKKVGYTAIGVGLAFALLYGILRKRKGALTAILMFIVGVAAATAMALLI